MRSGPWISGKVTNSNNDSSDITLLDFKPKQTLMCQISGKKATSRDNHVSTDNCARIQENKDLLYIIFFVFCYKIEI